MTGGWYGASLEPYFRRFGGRLKIVLHDDVLADPLGSYRSVLDHVGVDPTFVPSDADARVFSNARRRRWGARKKGLSADDRRELLGYFQEDLIQLEELVGRDLGPWRSS